MVSLKFLFAILLSVSMFLSTSAKKNNLQTFLEDLCKTLKEKKEEVETNITKTEVEELKEFETKGFDAIKQTVSIHKMFGISQAKFYDFLTFFFNKFKVEPYFFTTMKISLLSLLDNSQDATESFNFALFNKETNQTQFCTVIAHYDPAIKKINWVFSDMTGSGNKITVSAIKKKTVDSRGNVREEIDFIKKDEKLEEEDLKTLFNFLEVAHTEKIKDFFGIQMPFKFLQ